MCLISLPCLDYVSFHKELSAPAYLAVHFVKSNWKVPHGTEELFLIYIDLFFLWNSDLCAEGSAENVQRLKELALPSRKTASPSRKLHRASNIR